MGGRGLGGGVPEEEIVLRESGLDSVGWEVLLDVAESAAAVTGVDIDTLTEQLLHFWDERELSRNLKAIEGVEGGLQAAGHGAGVIALRSLDVLGFDQLLPQLIHVLGLLDSGLGEMSILPGNGLVAVQLGIVAL